MKCPICHSTEISFFAQKNAYRFNRCVLCKALFLPALPSESELRKYYAKQFSYHDGKLNECIIRKRAHIILKKLKQIAPTAKSMCDVGSGYGYFLDEAKNNGYKVLGIEPSRLLAYHAKKSYNVNSYIGQLNNFLGKKKQQFDIVTCIHVIEHVSAPKQFISDLLKLVKPGGVLFIETPNSDSHLLYTEKEHYTFLIPPEHLWIFAIATIKVLLPQNTQIIVTNTYSYSEHFMGILKTFIHPSTKAKNSISNFRKFEIKSPTTHITNTIGGRFRKKLLYYVFDCVIAPLFTGMLNIYHKGSILELYIKKKEGKSGL